jgi:dihydrofolate reductase
MKTSLLSIIVAMDENRLIGADNDLPWRLPDDMIWFRQHTMGKPVVMGRKTYESIPAKYRPLPGRHNIVITRNLDYIADGATVVHDVQTAVSTAGSVPEIIIGGGGNLYAQLLPQVDRLYVTCIDGRFSGDTTFPAFEPNEWQVTYRETHAADGRHAYSFIWRILDRKTFGSLGNRQV